MPRQNTRKPAAPVEHLLVEALARKPVPGIAASAERLRSVRTPSAAKPGSPI